MIQQEPVGGPDTFFTRGVPTRGTERISFDPGVKLTLGIGYRLPANFRLETELGWLDEVRRIIGLKSRKSHA